MYLYFYSIFNVGFYVFGHNVHLRLLRIHTDLYYIAIIGLYVIVFKLNLNIYRP